MSVKNDQVTACNEMMFLIRQMIIMCQASNPKLVDDLKKNAIQCIHDFCNTFKERSGAEKCGSCPLFDTDKCMLEGSAEVDDPVCEPYRLYKARVNESKPDDQNN